MGMKHGKGTEMGAGGRVVYQGPYKNDKRDGRGRVLDEDGKMHQRWFRQGYDFMGWFDHLDAGKRMRVKALFEKYKKTGSGDKEMDQMGAPPISLCMKECYMWVLINT